MKANFLKILKKRAIMLSLIIITAIGITVSGIVYDQDFFKMIPLYVSLSVMLFQSDALRIAPLIGGLNSILYAIVDYSYGLYGSALNDILFSFPFQIATFLLWTRKKDGATTTFRSLNFKWWAVLISGIVAVYIPALIINMRFGATIAPLDTYLLIGGFVSQMLMMLALREYSYFMVISTIITIVLNSMIIVSSPDRMCYLIYSIYSAICCIKGALTVHKIYKKQKGK